MLKSSSGARQTFYNIAKKASTQNFLFFLQYTYDNVKQWLLTMSSMFFINIVMHHC